MAASDWLLGPETQLASDHCGVSAEILDISSSVSVPPRGSFIRRRGFASVLIGKERQEGGPMYIGLGTLVLIVVVLLIIYLVRRA
jgi:hypothetical protein